MNNNLDENGNLRSDSERLTTIGSFIRKYSIDELPSLFNILLGQMSFVGPRPILAEYDKLYNIEQRKRFNVKPGITGWAQVNGRNAISWEEKFDLDIWYVNNRGFILDFKIILRTILKIFINDDVNSSMNNTMSKFKGNENN
jgi:lipopolysaccharide/colanic/teichoic acid biosynthesis glycosyltransferase